jgi:hypothetical protein
MKKRSPATQAPAAAGSMPPAAPEAPVPERACLAFGWTLTAVFLALGLLLESFHLIKLPFYLDTALRRELYTLAHAHGTLLGLANVLYALTAARCIPRPGRRAVASRLLRLGSLAVPLGFLLGGIGNAEGDPSPAILLVPAGAVLVLAVVVQMAWGARRAA